MRVQAWVWRGVCACMCISTPTHMAEVGSIPFLTVFDMEEQLRPGKDHARTPSTDNCIGVVEVKILRAVFLGNAWMAEFGP